MRTYLQTDPDSCFATCLACILELLPEDVPNFRRLQDENPSYDMIMEADKWLRKVHRKRFVSIELYEDKGARNTKQIVMNRLFHANIKELVILSGRSPRDMPDGSARWHCVIGRADCWGFEIVHDPFPGGGGLIGNPYGVKWIVPLDG